jgi:hypothetical protein
MVVRRRIMRTFAAVVAVTAALSVASGPAFAQNASPNRASTAATPLETIVLPAAHGPLGQVLAKAAVAVPNTSSGTYTLEDRCGGVSGDIEWQGFTIQIWGEVWENPASCGGAGEHSVLLSFEYLNILGQETPWSNSYGDAGPGQTVGYNSGYITAPCCGDIGYIDVSLCSTEGGYHCSPSQAF